MTGKDYSRWIVDGFEALDAQALVPPLRAI
jgi:hypothetical protein